MTAPGTRGSGAWQCDVLTENNVSQTPWYFLENSSPDIQGRLSYLSRHLSDLKEDLEEKEEHVRYIHELLESNTSEVSPGCEDILKTIAAGVDAARTRANIPYGPGCLPAQVRMHAPTGLAHHELPYSCDRFPTDP